VPVRRHSKKVLYLGELTAQRASASQTQTTIAISITIPIDHLTIRRRPRRPSPTSDE
jgi:hypothetical protein